MYELLRKTTKEVFLGTKLVQGVLIYASLPPSLPPGLSYGKPNVAIFNSFNFICRFLLCVQLCVWYSTYIQHSTSYSIFNFAFNVQLFILYSIPYSPIQLSIQQFQPFIQHSTLIFKTFNYSFNIQLFIQLFWALTTSGQWHRSLLLKT